MTQLELSLHEHSAIRIVNVGNQPWTDQYAGRRYVLAPGQEGQAPFGAVCLWFGHPDAVDEDDAHRYRLEEYQRLRVNYGAFDDQFFPDPTPDDPFRVRPINGDEKWERNRPRIECYDYGTGQRIITVMDDPEGKDVHTTTQTVSERDALMDHITTLTARLSALESQANVELRGRLAEENSEATADSPFTPPSANPASLDPNAPVQEDSPTRVRISS